MSVSTQERYFPILMSLPAYRYAPLSGDAPQIRLLTLSPGGLDDPLEGTLSVVTLADLEHDRRQIPDWEALSYRWRDLTPTRPLLISGQVLKINASLYVALQYLRRADGERKIWIDQVCVNQDDTQERGRQVKHMNVVYKKSGRVTAWLGTGDSDSYKYMEMLSVIKDLIHRGLYPRMEAPTSQQETILFEALTLEAAFRAHQAFRSDGTHEAKRRYLAALCRAFCENDWFQRLWIVQEAVLANHIVLQYGHVTVDWHVHAKACLELLWKELSVGSKLSATGISLTDTIQMLKDTNYGSSSRSLVVLLSALKNQKTTDAGDYVYGLMGMAELQEPAHGHIKLEPDYEKSNTIERLAVQLTLYCLQTEKKLDILSTCCAGSSATSKTSKSWIMKLEVGHSYCDQLFSTELRTLNFFSAGMSYPVQYHHVNGSDSLSLKGVEVDTVLTVSRHCHSFERFGAPTGDVWSEWKTLALRPQDNDPYGGDAGRNEAFWRTLITNQVWDDPLSKYIEATSHIGEQYGRWSNRQDLTSTVEAKEATKPDNEDGFYSFVTNLMVGNEAHLFRTKCGFIGLACKHVKEGDKVVVLFGGHLPFILHEVAPAERMVDIAGKPSDLPAPDIGHWEKIGTAGLAPGDSTSSDSAVSVVSQVSSMQEDPSAEAPRTGTTYKIIGGQVYLHGIMDGEALDDERNANLQFREFHIV